MNGKSNVLRGAVVRAEQLFARAVVRPHMLRLPSIVPYCMPLHARAILQQPQKPRSKSKLPAEKETSGTKSTDPCLFRARQNCTEKLTEIKCALVRSACLRLEQWHLYIEAMVRCTSGPCGVRQTTIQPDNYTTTQRWKHARQDQNICNWAVAL